eukprot:759837-Pleurochrysis_carterae.AAC.2
MLLAWLRRASRKEPSARRCAMRRDATRCTPRPAAACREHHHPERCATCDDFCMFWRNREIKPILMILESR